MAVMKTINRRGKYRDPGAREDIARYILAPLKVQSGFMAGVGITEDIVGSMNEVAEKFGKTNGVQLRHFIIAFDPDEIAEPSEAYEIGCQIACFLGQQYQLVFAVHEDTPNLHIHFMLNSISYRDGHRYSGTKKEYYCLINYLGRLLKREYGIILCTVSNRSHIDIQ